MQTRTTDVVILGAGTAGLNARREAERAGKDWLLVDPGPYGTTCARVGCMPSKLLIAAADAAHDARHAEMFGVHAEPVIDGKAVMARVRAERDRFVGFVVRDTEALDVSRRVHGRGRLEGPTTVIVDGHTRIEASSVVLATGSSPWVPPSLDAIADRVMVNDDVFELDDLPERLAVIGAGVIGLELGQALARLGVAVDVFTPSGSIGGIDDPAVLEVAEDLFAQAFGLHLRAEITEATPHGDGARLSWTDAHGQSQSETYTHVLAAAGRRPNTEGLGLERLPFPRDDRGRPLVDPSTMQLGELPIFLAGDAHPDRALLHEAADEGRIAGANAASFPDVHRGHRRTPLAIAFTDPQIAFVGARWSDVSDEPCFVAGEVSYADQGRARVMGKNAGIVRLYADKRDTRLVGATMFGPRVEHMAHLIAWAVDEGLTVTDALRRPFYHPVVEEGLRTALRDLARNLKVTHRCPPEDFAKSPGA